LSCSRRSSILVDDCTSSLEVRVPTLTSRSFRASLCAVKTTTCDRFPPRSAPSQAKDDLGCSTGQRERKHYESPNTVDCSEGSAHEDNSFGQFRALTWLPRSIYGLAASQTKCISAETVRWDCESSKRLTFRLLSTNGSDGEDHLCAMWTRFEIVRKGAFGRYARQDCSCPGQCEYDLSDSKQGTHARAVSDETHSAG
jgi:hypothetical protein